LPKLLRHTPDRSHTSSDGQKFEVRVDSLNANHSFKYFGKEQGVSVYTFRDEPDLLWHSLVFSAADRESAYVIDGLMHNERSQKRHSFHRCVWLQRSHLWHQLFGGRLLRAPFQEPQTSTTLYLQEPPTPGSLGVEN
jgi:hypothetical protein